MHCSEPCGNEFCSHLHLNELVERQLVTRQTLHRLVIITVLILPLAVTMAIAGKQRSTYQSVRSHAADVSTLDLYSNRQILAQAFASASAGVEISPLALPYVARAQMLNTAGGNDAGDGASALQLSGADYATDANSSAKGTNARVDVETTNITIVLEHIEVGPQQGEGAPWMFSIGSNPFRPTTDPNLAYFANEKFTWNPNGEGDSTCASNGSGQVSRGYIDPYHDNLGLANSPIYAHTSVKLGNLSLIDFVHVNMRQLRGQWDVLGQAGDTRRYHQGVLEIEEDGIPQLLVKDVQWIQNVSYPEPAGASPPKSFDVGAYFVGKIDALVSRTEWINKLDPDNLGYVLGVITGASFGDFACYSSNSYWITLRGFPKISDEEIVSRGASGAKVGPYKGSTDSNLSTARSLAGVAVAAVTAVTAASVGSALTCAGLAALGVSGGPSPPGNGVPRMLTTVAKTGKLNQIQGFHTDAMAEFGKALDPFLVRFNSPWAKKATGNHQMLVRSSLDMIRQAVSANATATGDVNSHPPSVATDLFQGCAFYCTLVVLGFMMIHGIVWLLTRKMPVDRQVKSHAWMVYMFSIVMSYIYTASVLNSMQYLRSNIPHGTGRPGLYVVAAFQLLFIGVGFTAFFFTIMYLAFCRIRQRDVRWVPKDMLADPDLRRNALIAGEYEADDNVWFHQLFESYYTAMSGPRMWLAAIELAITFLDAVMTALILNEVICLGILICIYAILFALFLVLSPFTDKVQGGLVCLLGLVQLIMLVFNFIASVGDFDVAEKLQMAGVVFGFISIALSVVIALYSDVIPTFYLLYRWLLRKYHLKKNGRDLVDPADKITLVTNRSDSDEGSDWSGLQTTEDEGNEGTRAMPVPADPIVEFNAEKEAEIAATMDCIFTEMNQECVLSDASMTVAATEVSGPGSPRSASSQQHSSRSTRPSYEIGDGF
jgi:hypothetical protein